MNKDWKRIYFWMTKKERKKMLRLMARRLARRRMSDAFSDAIQGFLNQPVYIRQGTITLLVATLLFSTLPDLTGREMLVFWFAIFAFSLSVCILMPLRKRAYEVGDVSRFMDDMTRPKR